MNTNSLKTPFGRLVAGICIGSFGQVLALIVPLALLLTIKLAMLDPANVTRNFSLVALFSAPSTIIGQYLAGYISDRTSWSFGRRRPWILIGAISGSILLYGVGTAKTFGMLVLFWSLASFMLNFVSCALNALIPDQVPENKRGTASGLIGVVSPLGIMIGINIMLMLNSWSIENKFMLLGIICIVCAIISCVLIKESKVEYKNERGSTNGLTFGEKMSRIYPSPKKHPAFTYGVLTRFFMAIAYASASYTSVYFIEHFHVAPEDLTGIVSLSTNITIPLLAVSSILGGILSDKIGRQKPFVFLSALVTAVGIVGYSFAPSISFSYICGAIVSLGFGMFLAVDIALMARILPHPEDAAKDMGIVNVANSIGTPIANAIASPLVAAGGYPLFFGVLSVFAVLAGVVVKPIPEVEKKAEPNITVAQ
jgi:MFS family permease